MNLHEKLFLVQLYVHKTYFHARKKPFPGCYIPINEYMDIMLVTKFTVRSIKLRKKLVGSRKTEAVYIQTFSLCYECVSHFLERTNGNFLALCLALKSLLN